MVPLLDAKQLFTRFFEKQTHNIRSFKQGEVNYNPKVVSVVA